MASVAKEVVRQAVRVPKPAAAFPASPHKLLDLKKCGKLALAALADWWGHGGQQWGAYAHFSSASEDATQLNSRPGITINNVKYGTLSTSRERILRLV